MPTTTTARGLLIKPDTLEAADVAVINANMDKISLYAAGAFLCTSTTRPSAPWQGMKIYETDTQYSFTWTGTQWVGVQVLSVDSSLSGGYVAGTLIYEWTKHATFTPDSNGDCLVLDHTSFTGIISATAVGSDIYPIVAPCRVGLSSPHTGDLLTRGFQGTNTQLTAWAGIATVRFWR